MKTRLVMVPSIKTPIMPAPGFQKKGLADSKLDLMALCGFSCSYCSSNEGNYLRINRERFADITEAQLGKRLYPSTSPELTMLWPDIIPKLEAQVLERARNARRRKLPRWGTGKTLVFSMLTDGFSPVLVGAGTTEKALRLVLEHTGFRIRVLTKNAVVGSDRWIKFFLEHPGRFVVGLSCGTLDETWARKVEIGTSSPRARAEATRALQDAGVQTFGMFCPIFPDAAKPEALVQLVGAFRASRCEDVWAEPFNDRANWKQVRDGYEQGSHEYLWLERAFGPASDGLTWSAYATQLYTNLDTIALGGGWAKRLKFLLYEERIAAIHAGPLRGLDGVLLQSKPDKDGYSPNPHIAALQSHPGHGRVAGEP